MLQFTVLNGCGANNHTALRNGVFQAAKFFGIRQYLRRRPNG
jgi:hypothetical protein